MTVIVPLKEASVSCPIWSGSRTQRMSGLNGSGKRRFGGLWTGFRRDLSSGMAKRRRRFGLIRVLTMGRLSIANFCLKGFCFMLTTRCSFSVPLGSAGVMTMRLD